MRGVPILYCLLGHSTPVWVLIIKGEDERKELNGFVYSWKENTAFLFHTYSLLFHDLLSHFSGISLPVFLLCTEPFIVKRAGPQPSSSYLQLISLGNDWTQISNPLFSSFLPNNQLQTILPLSYNTIVLRYYFSEKSLCESVASLIFTVVSIATFTWVVFILSSFHTIFFATQWK